MKTCRLDDFDGNWLSQHTDVSRILPFSVTGCYENYCQWPTDVNRYDKPRIRSDEISNLDQYQKNGNRYKLGYQHSADTPGESSINVSTLDTAKGFVGYDENNGTTTLQCVGELDNVCEDEPDAYTNAEIDAMVSTAPDNLKNEGQPTPLNSSELSDVGRGGQFTISRCWNSDTNNQDPIVTCQGNDCASANSNCQAHVSGCNQNMCSLSEDDAENGTRILIETANGFKTIGGITKDNMGSTPELFNVDQIRNITCDENHSKPSTDPTDQSKLFGGGTGIENIKIYCDTKNGTFTIDNKCGVTQCPQDISSINDLIHLTEHNANSVCPSLSMIDSHTESYSGTNTTPPQPAPISDIPVLTRNEYCSNLTADPVLHDYNKARYEWTGGTINKYDSCGIPSTLSDTQTGLTSIGTVVEKCNYEPNVFDIPKRSVSGCQPKICRLPQMQEGYYYDLNAYPNLTVGEKYSTDSLLNRNYYQTPNAQPSYLSDTDFNKITTDYSDGLIRCSTGYNGTVDIECIQTEDDINNNQTHEFNITGCNINKCVLPDPAPTEIEQSSTLQNKIAADAGGSVSVIDLLGTPNDPGITCKENFSQNQSSAITCANEGDGFQGIDSFCSENTCSIPLTLPADQSNAVYTIREDLGNENFPASVPADDNLRNYLRDIGSNINQNICYTNLPVGDTHETVSNLTNITCNTDYCDGVTVLGCTSDGQPLSIDGCQEKYCTLPSFSDSNNILYNFSGVRDKLETLEGIQGIGLTKSQVEATFSRFNQNLSCASFANQSGTNVTIDCPVDGQEFTLSGCSELDQIPDRTHTNGSVIYSYYPVGCNLSKDNAFVFLSGTDILGSGNDGGQSITHELDRSNVSAKPEVYYYRKLDPSDPDYLGDEPEYSVNIPDGWSNDGDNGWYSVPYYLHYIELEQSQINSRMEDFMNTSKDMCDKVDSCRGFNVTSFNAITSEIDAINKADARDETNGSVSESALQSFIQDPTNNFLEMGTFRSDQKGDNCGSHLDVTVVDFHNDWGQTTTAGGNSYIYRDHNGKDVLNPQVVPNNAPIYFKQIRTGDTSGDGSIGYTNVDEP